MARIDIVETKEYLKDTVAELIDRIENGDWGNSEIEGLVEELASLTGAEIDTANIGEVLEFLEELKDRYPPEETIEEIEKEIREREVRHEEIETLENKLSREKIRELEDLMNESVNASEEKKQRIEETLKRLSQGAPSEVEKYIQQIRENLKFNLSPKGDFAEAQPTSLFDKRDLEELTKKDEAKIVEEIVKTNNVTREEAKVGLAKAKMAEAKLRVDNFIETTIKNSEEYEYGNLIKVEMKRVFSGEKSKPEFPSAIDPIKAKKIDIEIERFKEKKTETVKQYQLNELEKEFDMAIANAPSQKEQEELTLYKQAIRDFHNVTGPQILNDRSRKVVEDKMEAEGKSFGEIQTALHNVDATVKSVQHTPNQIRDIIEKAKGISSLSRKLVPNNYLTRSFDNFVKVYENNPVVQNMHRLANIKVEWTTNLITKIPGVNTLMAGAGEVAGFAAASDFIALATTVMAEQGTIPGAIAIFRAITTGGGVLAKEAGVEGLTALSSMLGAFQGIPVLGQVAIVIAMIIMAGWWIFDNIIKPLYNSFNDFLKRNFNLNLGGIRDFLANDLNLGGIVGGLGQMAFTAGTVVMGGMALLFGPIMAMGLSAMTAIIAPVVGFFVIGMLVYNMFITSPMISSLVPPPPMAAGGTCQPKEDIGTPAPSSGEVNCNQNAPENNTGINKDNFVNNLAKNWHSGTNYSKECFNDVVNRALCAGVNPQYALWAWIHESGASNYSIKDVKDFGIYGQPSVPPRNFDKQIGYFLKLNPGTKCPTLGYWLSLATNYLTGGCDPKKEIPQADGTMMTGEKYLAEIQNQWGWIKPGSLPDNIVVPKGGQNCGGNSNSKPVATADNEFVNSDGVLMVCSGPVDENGNFIGIPGESKYDPNAPGLEGEKVAGECSVASKVVSTKQCGQSWSNIGLPGGSGTICSAGCGPSSASSILQSRNRSLTPDSVIFEPGSPYSSMNGGGSSLGQAQSSLGKHGFSAGNLGTCSQKDIANWICQGNAVMILSDSDTGNGSTIGHILVAVAVSKGDIIVKDPYYSNRTPFATKGEGNIRNLRQCLTVQVGKD